MAAPIKISTSKYTKSGKVEIDGMMWDVKLPGAGTELRMAQIEREVKVSEARIKNLEKRIDSGSATDDEIDRYETLCETSERLQKETYATFEKVFKDGTDDNASVKKWLAETPTIIQFLVFEDVKKGGETANEPEAESTESS